MSDDAYIKLRGFLNSFPVGFPETESGVEMKILKRLFTKEEAETVVLLTPVPQVASRIARQNKMDKEELEKKLEAMARKGLIFRVVRNGKTYYNASPFMIGIYEYSVNKIDKELAELYKEYYDTIYQEEIGFSNVPGFKVIPVEETIETETVLLPYQKLKESIKNARVISVADCICRKEAILNDEGCDRPMETCLHFGAAAEYYIHRGVGRQITAEEAIKIIEEADKAGLVHAGSNSKHLGNICNCCPCCCVSMKGITQKGMPVRKFMNPIFESIIDQELCTGCETCIERCPVSAISVDNTATVNRNLCLGCGLCASVCPEEAITLELRADRVEPFDRVLLMGQAIIEGKRKNLELKKEK